MQGKTRNSLRIISADDGIICFERKHAGDRIFVLLNFNSDSAACTLPMEGSFRTIFDSASPAWNGPRDAPLQTVRRDEPFNLLSESALIFEP